MINEEVKIYTLSIQYFATGEGFHIYIGVVRSVNKEDAISLFRENSFKDNDDAWNFYKKGLEVSEGMDKDILSMFLSPTVINQIEENIGFRNLYFRYDTFSLL